VALLEISLSTCYTSTPSDYKCLASGWRARRADVRSRIHLRLCRPLRIGARAGAVRDVCPRVCTTKIGPSAAVRPDMAELGAWDRKGAEIALVSKSDDSGDRTTFRDDLPPRRRSRTDPS
jgi:hypothetical protein